MSKKTKKKSQPDSEVLDDEISEVEDLAVPRSPLEVRSKVASAPSQDPHEIHYDPAMSDDDCRRAWMNARGIPGEIPVTHPIVVRTSTNPPD